MSLKMLRTSFLAVGLVGATVANAQEETSPPLNTPIYEPQCGATGLIATFKVCTLQMVPVVTAFANGQPMMTIITPAVGCQYVAAAANDRGLDKLEAAFSHNPSLLERPMAQARADMADPTRACPSAAMF
jgi:hypothetical protein